MIPLELVVFFAGILLGYVLGRYTYSEESEDDDS